MNFILKTTPITHVLEDRGLMPQMKQYKHQWVGPCPIHGGDNPRAFVVSQQKNLWNCFTQCQGGGDVITFVMRLDNSSYRQAINYLKTLSKSKIPLKKLAPTSNFKPFTQILTLDTTTPVLQQKGILAETAHQFQAGVYHPNGFLKDCIAVRFHDLNGNPLGYAGRRLDPDQAKQYGKWKFPRAFPKAKILFNFHRIKNPKLAIVVVECPWGVMRLQQLQIPAVALLGTHISSTQLEQLAKIPNVIVMFDGDVAGQSGALKTCLALQPFTQSYLVPLSDGQDPDDLSDSKLTNMLHPFFP